MAALQSDPGSHITPGHPQPLVTDSREPGEGFVSGAQILLFFLDTHRHCLAPSGHSSVTSLS